jgi:CDP-diacylglycerol--serine O-phosphatidyltransferase
MRWSVGPIGIKDLFTLINLMGGVAAVYLLLDGRPEPAGVALIAGYLLGDALDGVVARATHTANRFGAEFDSVTDHLTQAIVPAIIVYAVYAAAGHRVLGFVLMAALMASGTIRHALFSVSKMNIPLMYCGLPRTISGYASMSFVLSRLFFKDARFGIEIGAVLIPALAAAGLLPIPYMTHRGTRRMQTWVKALVLGFLVTPVVAFFALRDFTFDVLFVWTMGYALFAWFPLRADERKAFFDRYRQWAVEVSR